ncbi:F-box domain containing protein [Tanacetum coccineum]|uniref:F-box domain containing protein n=1 Tax=Tanacetum coccineum TaxID=301880 RepID=A0ABQ5FVS7_9ASTR
MAEDGKIKIDKFDGHDFRNDENIADYVSEEYDEDPENIDFHVEGEQDVEQETFTLLSGILPILPENDSDDDLIDGEYKIKKGVKYPSYNPETTWDEFQPILGMNFENPLQLKNALADYDVKHGYQLWYYRSDYKSSLVYYGKDIELGICAGRKGMKKKKKGIAEGDKVKGKQVVEESDLVKGNREAKASLKKPMKWTRMMVLEHKGHHYPFRLWASLIEHYGKLWEYRKAVLDSNPGLTCHLDVDVHDNGQNSFHRFYVCFKGVKDGWLSGCRKVIGIDGCFITHVCKGELLTAMGMDENNQMYPIAWAVVDVENKNNWCWFLFLLADDLQLEEGLGLTIISDSHKGLIDAVRTWLPQEKHKHCARHLKMREIRALDEEAYAFLMEKSLQPGVRLISKQLQGMLLLRMEFQSHSMLKYFLLEVMELKWVPCIHVVASFMHFKLNPDIRVSSWYSLSKWFNTYQFSIKLVYRSKMWRSTINTPPLPPIVKTMPGRSRKNRIKHPSEKDDEHHISRVGRVMTCQKCWRQGHNKSSCTNPRRDKPTKTDRPPRPQKSCVYTTSKNKKCGISINDICKTQKQVGESNKRGEGSFSRGRGTPTMGRGSTNKRGRFSKQEGGSASLGRGSQSKRGGFASSRSKRGRPARKGCADNNNTQFINDRDAIHEAMDEEERKWEQVLQDDFFKGSTLSVLEAVNEAIQEHNDGLPSISEGQVDGNSEHPISQPTPTLLKTTIEESHTPRTPRPRPQIQPRGKSERIAKKRKFNYPEDGTSKTPGKPFSL